MLKQTQTGINNIRHCTVNPKWIEHSHAVQCTSKGSLSTLDAVCKEAYLDDVHTLASRHITIASGQISVCLFLQVVAADEAVVVGHLRTLLHAHSYIKCKARRLNRPPEKNKRDSILCST